VSDTLQSTLIKGTTLSSGVSRGSAYVVTCTNRLVATQRRIEPADVTHELKRFDDALAQAETDLRALERSVKAEIGAREAAIFAAQGLLVRDNGFHDEVAAIVRDRQVNVEAALSEVIERFMRTFDKVSDAYLRERATDIRDVGRRVLDVLLTGGVAHTCAIPEGAIVVADELLPSAAARLDFNRVRAFVTERGGKFSHTAILARSLGTPAVAGISNIAEKIHTGDRLIVDGVSGVIFVNPEPSVEREYERLEADIRSSKEALRSLADLPSLTLDGTRVQLLATVSKFPDTEAALLCNAEGIGLYRTEFGFTIRNAFPTEDEQYEFLKRAAERFHPRPVVFRLLDLGGDKELPYLPLPRTRNPSLAQRGIRLLLQHQDVLRTQLRAFLRVSADHPVSILLPMVGGVEDVRRTRAFVRDVQQDLAADGRRFNVEIPIGAMIEVPAAALLLRSLAREVDFFSLGTNDLVQYLLAADREDENASGYYQPLHPAVLQLIQSVAEAARRAGRELSICGEIAGDPRYTPLLVGLGLRVFSVSPGEMLTVKRAVRAMKIEDAEKLAVAALSLGTADEIEHLLSA
jgi:phosphotransferase system enzyme I (PtsI)